MCVTSLCVLSVDPVYLVTKRKRRCGGGKVLEQTCNTTNGSNKRNRYIDLCRRVCGCLLAHVDSGVCVYLPDLLVLNHDGNTKVVPTMSRCELRRRQHLQTRQSQQSI